MVETAGMTMVRLEDDLRDVVHELAYGARYAPHPELVDGYTQEAEACIREMVRRLRTLARATATRRAIG